MITITVLLRSLVRICEAEGALVARDGAHRVLVEYGLTAEGAVRALQALQSGAILPDGLRCAWTVPLARSTEGPAATLHVLTNPARASRPSSPDDTFLTPTVTILAAEIAHELDRQAVDDGIRILDASGVGLADLVTGVDALNDAALIIEWPLAGTDPRILYVNSAFEQLLGYDASAAVGQSLQFLYGPLTEVERTTFMRDRVRATREARIPIVYYRRDGVPIWVEVSVRGSAGSSTSVPYMVATLRDVSTRKEFEYALAREKRKLQVTLAAIGDGVITTVADGRIDYVNLAARAMLGIDAAEAYGEPISDMLCLSDPAGNRVDVLHAADKICGGSRGQAQLDENGSVKFIAYVSSPIGTQGYVVVLRDVTAQQRLSSQLSYEASHDPLTRIYNRRKFERVLEDAIGSTQRNDGPHALGFLDLDRFKYINDNCGHAVGDRVLVDLAQRLQEQLRGRDVLARIGGDEFAVLLHDCTLDNARRVLEKLRRAVETYRIFYAGDEYSVGVSIGLTAIDGSELDGNALVARADAACYAAKSRGRNAVAG